MCQVSLGFSKDPVPFGTHICLVYTSEKERVDVINKFLLSGIQNDERSACFSNKTSLEELQDFFESQSISFKSLLDNQALSLYQADDAYFANGCFDPDRMLGALLDYCLESQKMGFSAARIIGEMSPKINSVPGGERLLEYETRVNDVFKTHKSTIVCQYDANEFDGATIMDILKVHPKVIVNGSVIDSPFYTHSEASSC